MRSPRPSLAALIGIGLVVVLALAHSREIHARAAAGLGTGMPAREAELARGFVLGDDEGIDPQTTEDFRRAGLSHLLAVSGENVTLLALLAMPLLAALGIPLRERLVWVIGLVAVYVPVAGAGPSVQRAAVMGVVGLVATLAGRRASRLYALGLAALLTLAFDPGIASDVGWQLSFAAVLGILLLASPLRDWLVARLGPGDWRRALAEGIAVTVAATLATAPLIAFHFETLSTTTLLANVLALPAVAPAMWLGMLSGALAQLPGMPLAPVNGLDAILLAYIAQVASWCAAPDWAEVGVHLGAAGLLAAYACLAAVLVALRFVPRSRPIVCALAAAAILVLLAPRLLSSASAEVAGSSPDKGLRVEVLDVGQGDAILFRPAGAPAVLIDGGPPGDGIAEELGDAGVDRLGAAIVTHDQADHAGGIEELLGHFPIESLLYARSGRDLLSEARAAGVATRRIAAGRELRAGRLRLRVLWPPVELLRNPLPGQDPNQLGVVALAEWERFRMLLTADAEAEAVPLDPGPVDVLKVAHHGSDDGGLDALLQRIRPRLAVISVGSDNPYGHPTAGTLATLAREGVPVLRTDRDGSVVIDVDNGGMRVDG